MNNPAKSINKVLVQIPTAIIRFIQLFPVDDHSYFLSESLSQSSTRDDYIFFRVKAQQSICVAQANCVIELKEIRVS